MAPLTRSISYTLPELPLEAPGVQTKDLQARYSAANTYLPRLVALKSKSGSCSSCSNASTKACADCCGLVFYCNAVCQTAHWPEHKENCQDLKDQHISEVMEARDTKALNQITEDLGKIISSDFKSLDYKDTKLSVKIDDSALFGDFYDVSETSQITNRPFHPGTYKCTSVNSDESCAPITIYHHVSVDPVKIMKQCILMSKDFFEHNDLPNQITMPQWCNWESADEEYIPSDSESEASDSEISESDLIFADFVDRVFGDKPAMESDTEDQDYDSFSETESESSTFDESEVSDHEFFYLIEEGSQYIRNVSQKRQSTTISAEMEVAEDSDGKDSEAEAYNDFREKVLEFEHKYTSDSGDSDYLPYSDSDSDSGESIPERDISDSEKCISDNEVEIMLESSKDLKDMDEEMYNEFLENVLDRYYLEESDVEDEDYTSANEDSSSSSEEDEISDTEANALLEESKILLHSLSGKRLSMQTEFYSSESDTDSEVSSEGELYEDFKIHTEDKHDLSETEDLEYIPEQSASEESSSSSEDEMEISDAESDAVLDDSKDDVKEVSGQKRKCLPEDEASQDSDNEAEMESDDILYNDFRTKLFVNDPSKVEDLGDSEDDEFVPPAESQDSQDESQDLQDDSQNEGSQASDQSDDQMDVSEDEIHDLELSSEDEIYEEFKDEVCKTQRKELVQKSVSITPSDNKEIIYFIDSKYASSFKDSFSNKVENGSEIAGSFLLKNGSEAFGIAVEMKGQTWRSAHVFEDSTSGKCFALVISTDTLEHLSNNYEHLEAQYPDQKWSSVSETELKFQMKEFLC